MIGIPVVVVEAGGLPVVNVAGAAPAVVVASLGVGTPMTLLDENGDPYEP